MAKGAVEQLPDNPVTRFARAMFTDHTREAAAMSPLLEGRQGSPP